MTPSPPPGGTTNHELHDGGFQALLNFRDVAATVNAHQSRRLLREGLLYRSARPDEATPADRQRLRTHYGLRSVIDLRSKTEHAKAAEKLRRQQNNATKNVPGPNDPSVDTTSNTTLAAAVQHQNLIPGVTYHEVRVTGSGFERHLIAQLSWWSFFCALFLHLTGRRMSAVAILGREVMGPRGLLGLGCDTLDASGPDIAAGLAVFLADGDGPVSDKIAADEVAVTPSSDDDDDDDDDDAKSDNSNGVAKKKKDNSSPLPLLIHCTQGKDRTGLMVALVLLICEVPLDAVAFDYALTDEKLAAMGREEREERLAEIREMGMPDDYGVTAKGFVPGIVAHLDDKYGGLEPYLDRIGFGPDKRARLREKLLY